ncbi:response regulator transcription factor [Rathayibacter oskolensis]|uniref:LuxR C-terminal-related transcriptional regulator n=1 Tax=Rathayibacter oskolensis TaxID=1891671 RepID=UPI00265EBF9F|nr:response regulator transcription factor [Rathayibacter oskolensis]WKK71293.1 response regulator transcription factor [Rathayibacter oskolensis]
MTPITVFLLDDHEIVRRGVSDLLSANDDIEVVGEAGTAAQAMTRIQAVRPAIRAARCASSTAAASTSAATCSRTSGVQCIVLAAYDDEEAVYAAVLAGAAGSCSRTSAGQDSSTRCAPRRGRRLLDPTLRRAATTALTDTQSTDPRLAGLGLRERQILGHIAEGMTNRQIGVELGLAEKTVKNYVSSLLAKLGLERRTQAAVLELEHRRATP